MTTDPAVVFGGDVLFRGGIGRHDMPNSGGRLLLQGIRDKLLSLAPETVVYRGHGPRHYDRPREAIQSLCR